MEEREKRDVLLVAAEMMRRFADEAAAKMESWSRINHLAGEREAAAFWLAVAEAIRALESGTEPGRANGQ